MYNNDPYAQLQPPPAPMSPPAPPAPPAQGGIAMPPPQQQFQPTRLGILDKIMGQQGQGQGSSPMPPPPQQTPPQAAKAGIIGKVLGMIGL